MAALFAFEKKKNIPAKLFVNFAVSLTYSAHIYRTYTAHKNDARIRISPSMRVFMF